MIFLSRHRARLLLQLLFACLSLPSHAQAPAAQAGTEPVVEKPKSPSAKAAKPPATTQAKQLPSVSVAVSQQPPGVSADAATSAASSASKAAAPPAKPAVPATTTTAPTASAATAPAPAKTIAAAPTPQPIPAPINAAATAASPTKPAVAAAGSAPAKPAVATKPAVAAGNAPAYGTISESERRALATMPLPKLPTLVPREKPATSIAAATAEAALPAAIAPSIRPSVTAESPTATEIRALLSKASERTGLDDAQLARIVQLDATAARGEQENALVGLLRLNDELDAATNSYNVGPGESLWQIAAKPETYGNANLWPLIWRANPKSLPQPSQVKSGQKLRMPRYPSLKAVTEALDYAASHPVEKQ